MPLPVPGPPDAAALERLADEAMARLPEPFRDYLGDVVVRIEEFADREALAAVGIRNPWNLAGLYHGRPLSRQSIWATGDMPPMITLYRSPLLREWRETGVALDDLITHVVVHEVGHHFGLSDDDMHRIEDEDGP
ncbi:MAG: metallopeptidase family protein [Novosphingobium sp.]|jgi:predicted Zn-dependent protease with MMP-like domain|nr:metallopeptidase family protein [Novosphingobium sp.]